jgi:hypothetical protein
MRVVFTHRPTTFGYGACQWSSARSEIVTGLILGACQFSLAAGMIRVYTPRVAHATSRTAEQTGEFPIGPVHVAADSGQL